MSNGSRLTFLSLTAVLGFAACVADLGDAPGGDGTMSSQGSGGNHNGSGGGSNIGTGGKVNTGGTGGVGGSLGTGGLRVTGGGGNGGANIGTGGSLVGTGGRIGTGGGSGTGGRGVGGTGAGGTGVGGSGVGGSGVGGTPGTLACVKPGPEYTNNTGSVTFYTLSQGSNGVVHCSYEVTGQNPDVIAHIPTGAGQYFAAMNTADYNGAHTCGACVEVTRDGSRKVVATVVDECPIGSNNKCVRGHINLSMNAFLQIGTAVEGFLGTGNTLQPTRANVGSISWRYVPCPVTGNVFARIKQGNQNEIFFENLITPIKSVSMNGQTSNVLQTYNAWNFGNTNITTGASFVVTDIDNSVINFSIGNMTQNADQDTGKRFATCQ